MVKKHRKILPSIFKWLDRDETIVISGPRRVGKTTTLYLLKDELLSRGIPPQNIIMLNLEDIDILKELSGSPKALLKFMVAGAGKNYFLIDEIQYLKEPTNFLKYHFDANRDRIKLIVTGSYLFEVKGEFRDSLVGRKVSFDLTPLTFEEFIDFRKPDLLPFLKKSDLPEVRKNELLSLLDEYLVYGGMPEVVQAEDVEIKQMLLKEYVNTYLQKDIRYISGSNDILRYNDLLSILANQISGLLNIEEVSNTLGLRRDKVVKYLENLILSGIVYLIPPFYTNIRTQISKMKKVFLFDVGIRNRIINNFNHPLYRMDAGALYENWVLNELINAVGKENVFYYRTRSGSEIDFVVKEAIPVPFEVKYKKLVKPTGIRALKNFLEKNRLPRGYLINLTLNQSLPEKNIEIVDYLRFLQMIWK